MRGAQLSATSFEHSNRRERSLTVCSKSGLSNRIKILISGLAIAEASDRTFHMLWPLTAACACPYENLFDNKWEVRTVSEDDVVHIPQLTGWFDQLEDLLKTQDDHFEISYVDWLVKPASFSGHDQLWERCKQIFLELQPTAALKARINSIINSSFRPTMLGVHIRRGDFLRARPEASGNTEAILSAIDAWLNTHPHAGILLCTDDGAVDPFTGELHYEGIRELFLQRYGDRVFIPKSRSLNRADPEAIQDALVELLLLRETNAIIGTAGSTFSYLAAFSRDAPAQFFGGGNSRYRRFEFCMRATGIYYIVIACAKLQFKRYVPFQAAWSYYCLKLGKPVYKALNRFLPNREKR